MAKYQKGLPPRVAVCQCVNCIEDKQCGGLWNGETSSSLSTTEKLVEVAVVVSHCLQPLHWLINFTKGYRITHTFIISKCGNKIEGAPIGAKIVLLPNVGRCDHTYSFFMDQLSKTISSEYVVFLKDQRSDMNLHCDGVWRSLQGMLKIASVKGFACGMKPTVSKELGAQLSAYHISDVLKSYSMSDYVYRPELYAHMTQTEKFKSNFINLGEWVHFLETKIPETLSEVCYGGTFVASMHSIQSQSHNVWRNMERSLSRGSNIEEGHFAERVWAGLLSTQLLPFQENALYAYSEGYANLSISYVGTLIHKVSSPMTGYENSVVKV